MDENPGVSQLEIGLLVGILVGEGSFGGDGRQPAITVRMHIRHENLFRRLLEIVPGSRLYGPYHHSGRSYFQWFVRGPALRALVPLLDRYLSPDIDAHAAERYERMKQTYARQLRPRPPEGTTDNL